MENISNNILIKGFDLPPFNSIEMEDYKPAILWAIERSKERIDAITSSQDTPSFENVIAPLELAGRELERITSIFFNLNHSNTSEEMQELAMELSPILTEYSNSIALNMELFAKIKSVYNGCKEELDSVQKRVLEKCYKSFARSGANLPADKQERYKEITTELSKLTLMFDQNLLAATNDYFLVIKEEEELAGLPDFVIEGAKEEATEREIEGWVITLQAQSMIPFMQYSERRELRETIWRKHSSRCYNSEKNNNVEIIKKIINLRLEKANLLGYETHADFILEERMAKNKERVFAFLDELAIASAPYGVKDIKIIEDYAKSLGLEERLMQWDFAYYSERYRKEVFSLSDDELKPYFELSKIKESLFELSKKLYGINIRSDKEIEGYHDDVETYRVYDSAGVELSTLYLDFFPRATKSGGAWMTTFREYHMEEGQELFPQVSVVCNFSKPTASKPSLLTFNEVTTLFHEFGHALHGIFSRSAYPSVSGTNVAWDFVELPSQIMENWAIEKEFLLSAAIHYESGEPISEELIDRIINARNFLSGYASMRQLSFGLGDMAWHTITEPFVGDIKEFEEKATERCKIFSSIKESCFAPAFSHIFSGGYSAGYYSYKWAEVLEADAYTRFINEGVFNSETANSFREAILSKGDSADAMELYINFMGREPKVEPLLVKLGLKESCKNS